MAKSFFPNLECEICSTKFSGRFCRARRTCSKECLHILKSRTNGRPKGYKHTDEQKQKMSVMFSGTNNPFYGKIHSPEARAKISSSLTKRVGVDSRRWIKDRTKLAKRQERNDSSYKDWRRLVKERDAYKCKIANNDCSGKLIVHHILGWTKFPELRYELNNGITLCQHHHPRRRLDETRLVPTFREIIKLDNVR